MELGMLPLSEFPCINHPEIPNEDDRSRIVVSLEAGFNINFGKNVGVCWTW